MALSLEEVTFPYIVVSLCVVVNVMCVENGKGREKKMGYERGLQYL